MSAKIICMCTQRFLLLKGNGLSLTDGWVQEAMFCRYRLICLSGLKFDLRAAFIEVQKISAIFVFKDIFG